MQEPIDKAAVYEAKVAPLTRELHRLCAENGIPMVVLMCLRLSDRGEEDMVGMGCAGSPTIDTVRGMVAYMAGPFGEPEGTA